MKLRVSYMIIIIAAFILTACAPRYACKKTMPGKKCASLSEVYAEEVLGVEGTKEDEVELKKNADAASSRTNIENGSTKKFPLAVKQTSSEKIVNPVDIVEEMDYEEKYPILKPPKIIRIWISPWVDNNGDLNMGGYIYTEIQDKKWILGEEIAVKGIGTLSRNKIEKSYDILKK